MNRPTPQQKRAHDAKRVFKGILFDVYQWKQKMFDGSEAVFEQLTRPDTVEVIPILENGKILLVHEEQPGKKAFLSVPGGRMDEGEEPVAAALRELKEETGYVADETELWQAVQPVGKIDWAIYTFIARGCRKVSDVHLDPGERISTQEVSFDEFFKIAREGRLWDHLTIAAYKAELDSSYKQELRRLFGV